jgi:hypothetical protein
MVSNSALLVSKLIFILLLLEVYERVKSILHAGKLLESSCCQQPPGLPLTAVHHVVVLIYHVGVHIIML